MFPHQSHDILVVLKNGKHFSLCSKRPVFFVLIELFFIPLDEVCSVEAVDLTKIQLIPEFSWKSLGASACNIVIVGIAKIAHLGGYVEFDLSLSANNKYVFNEKIIYFFKEK